MKKVVHPACFSKKASYVHEMTVFQKSFRQLLAWQESHRLCLMIYKTTEGFPASERYRITDQLCRAASSAGALIAEGSRMRTAAHRRSYYERAYASVAEVDNFLELAKDLNYISSEVYHHLCDQLNQTSFLLHRLKESTQSPPRTSSVPS